MDNDVLARPFPNHILGMDKEEESKINKVEKSIKIRGKKVVKVKLVKVPSGSVSGMPLDVFLEKPKNKNKKRKVTEVLPK